jgi:tripartite-type tricarboxylate transporter receptor subunit TctC
MKKIMILIMVALTSLVIVACSSGTSTNEGSSSENSNSNENSSPSESSEAGVDYPNDNVKLIIPWGSGGNADLFGRKLMSVIENNIGQTTVVENQTGAGGEVAITNFALEQPDPHTILTTSASNFSLMPQFKEVKFSEADFKPVVGNIFTQFVLMTNPSETGIETLEDLQEYAKDRTIKFASAGGPGSDTYTIQAALFKEMGIQAESVVVDGGMGLVNNLLGGHVDVTLGIQPLADQYFQNGELKPIATFSPESYELEGIDPVLPLPELGYDITYRSLNFVNVSKDTPDEIVNIIYEEFIKAYEDEEFKEFVEENSFVMAPMNSEEITEFMENQKTDMKRFLDIIND